MQPGEEKLSDQQRQAKEYFSRAATEWRAKATASDTYNIVRVRNNFVLDRVAPLPLRALDLGCGTGELAMALAERGNEVTAVDFASEMIENAKRRAGNSVKFVEASVLDLDFPPGSFDLVIANGLVEYLSREEWTQLAGRISHWLPSGGSFFVHFRNRLFNVFSHNDYTLEEERLGTLHDLHKEIRGEAKPRTDYPAFSEHPLQEIEVKWRHQYTPAEAKQLLTNLGFFILCVQPAHFHAFPPSFKEKHPQLHDGLATEMQPLLERNKSLLPQCSSFLIEATRER